MWYCADKPYIIHAGKSVIPPDKYQIIYEHRNLITGKMVNNLAFMLKTCRF